MIVGRRTEKLMERSVGPYKVKKIVSLNAVELELPNTIKIHLVVNVSRIHKYVRNSFFLGSHLITQPPLQVSS